MVPVVRWMGGIRTVIHTMDAQYAGYYFDNAIMFLENNAEWLWAELSAMRNTQAEEEEKAGHAAMYLKCMGHVKE